MHPPHELHAVVTGATRGIGECIAQRLIALGMRVTVTGRKPDGAGPKGTEYEAADFEHAEAIEAFAVRLGELKPHILINNAGISLSKPVEDTTLDDFDRLYQVNLKAPFRLSQAVLPAMRERKWGRIVQIGSLAGMMAIPLRSAYSASKFALDGMNAVLAAETAKDGILANVVAPGFIDTELARSVRGPEAMAAAAQTIPITRLAQPDEVAAFAVWLAGPENTYLTGQSIAVDGGFSRI